MENTGLEPSVLGAKLKGTLELVAGAAPPNTKLAFWPVAAEKEVLDVSGLLVAVLGVKETGAEVAAGLPKENLDSELDEAAEAPNVKPVPEVP